MPGGVSEHARRLPVLRTGDLADVKAHMPAATDGTYKLYLAGDPARPWMAYCAQMATATTPREYLSLTGTNSVRCTVSHEAHERTLCYTNHCVKRLIHAVTTLTWPRPRLALRTIRTLLPSRTRQRNRRSVENPESCPLMRAETFG